MIFLMCNRFYKTISLFHPLNTRCHDFYTLICSLCVIHLSCHDIKSNALPWSPSLNSFLLQTTYENFRNRYNKKKNPYNQGILNNLKEIFFTKIPPSLVNFREVVFEDDHSFTDSVRSKEKVDIENEGLLGGYGSRNVYATLKNLDLSGVNYSTKGKGKEIKTVGSFEIGAVSAPLDQNQH